MVAIVLCTRNDKLYYDPDYKTVSVGLGVDAVHTSALFANDREHEIRLDPSLPGWWLIFGPTPSVLLLSDCLRGRAFMYCIAGSNADRCFSSMLLTVAFSSEGTYLLQRRLHSHDQRVRSAAFFQ